MTEGHTIKKYKDLRGELRNGCQNNPKYLMDMRPVELFKSRKRIR